MDRLASPYRFKNIARKYKSAGTFSADLHCPYHTAAALQIWTRATTHVCPTTVQTYKCSSAKNSRGLQQSKTHGTQAKARDTGTSADRADQGTNRSPLAQILGLVLGDRRAEHRGRDPTGRLGEAGKQRRSVGPKAGGGKGMELSPAASRKRGLHGLSSEGGWVARSP